MQNTDMRIYSGEDFTRAYAHTSSEVRGMFYERGAIGLIRQAVKKEWWRDCGLDGVFCPDCLEK